MIYLCAQPVTNYYAWQVATMLRSFLRNGVEPGSIHVVGAVTRCVPPSWRAVLRTYPGVRFAFYHDRRTNPVYALSIRPYVLAQHWEGFPELEGATVFYHDCDIVLTRPPAWDHLAEGKTWHVSDCRSYIGVDYLRSKGHGLYEGMCELMGLDPGVPEANDAGAGGAQYVMKGIDADWWRRMYEDSETLYAYLRRRTREIKADPATPEKYHEIQVFTADMWAMLWGAWRAGHKTAIAPELAFTWATDLAERWDERAIYHNAGVTARDRERLFHKGDYIHQEPYAIENHVNPRYASHRYLEEVKAAGAVLIRGAVPCRQREELHALTQEAS